MEATGEAQEPPKTKLQLEVARAKGETETPVDVNESTTNPVVSHETGNTSDNTLPRPTEPTERTEGTAVNMGGKAGTSAESQQPTAKIENEPDS